VIAPITITSAVNNDGQSSDATTSSSYENFEYNSKFAGSVIHERIVETAVIVTERAKSPLNMEHHLMDVIDSLSCI
jgi:hypothetical protein